MRVKLFWINNPLGPGGVFNQSHGNASALEDEINAWLGRNASIRVRDVKQSASGGSFGASLWLISVWYEDEEGT